jgi:hypothetical protein
VKSTFISQPSQNVQIAMSTPVSGLGCSLSSVAFASLAHSAHLGFIRSTLATTPIASSATILTDATVATSTYATYALGVVAETAAENMTHVNGLACTPPAAKKHDRKNNWQLRPLSLCGESG